MSNKLFNYKLLSGRGSDGVLPSRSCSQVGETNLYQLARFVTGASAGCYGDSAHKRTSDRVVKESSCCRR